MKDIMDYIYGRRSIRSFTDQEVDSKQIDLLLKAAMAAPSSCDRKPWEYVVISEENILKKIEKYLDNEAYSPKLAIVVCGNMDLANCTECEGMKGECSGFWIQDCSASMENILLAASGLGLGSVWIGAYPITGIVKFLSETLNLPANIIPLSIAYIGYSNELIEPRTQYDAAKVHMESYKANS